PRRSSPPSPPETPRPRSAPPSGSTRWRTSRAKTTPTCRATASTPRSSPTPPARSAASSGRWPAEAPGHAYPWRVPDHALELSFDAASEHAVVAQWEALKAAGLPSQADHRSMTNAPHLTLVAAVGIDAALVPEAAETVGPRLPAQVHLRGLLLLGD